MHIHTECVQNCMCLASFNKGIDDMISGAGEMNTTLSPRNITVLIIISFQANPLNKMPDKSRYSSLCCKISVYLISTPAHSSATLSPMVQYTLRYYTFFYHDRRTYTSKEIVIVLKKKSSHHLILIPVERHFDLQITH